MPRSATVLLALALTAAFCPAGACATTMTRQISPELNAAILATPQGDIVDVEGLSMPDLPRIPWEKKASGPQFVITDDPEYIKVPEAAPIRETLRPGRARLYVYHVNATTDTATKKISAVVENLGDRPMSLRMIRAALAEPTDQYYEVGKSGLVQFLGALNEESTAPARTVAPGEAAVLDENMDALRPKYNELVHGWYEFEIDRPARLTVLQTGPDTPAVEANRRITSVLASRRGDEGAGRGLFQTSTYDVENREGFVLDPARGPMQLVVADGKSDPWITGTDASRSTQAVNKGNYGVIYKIRLRRSSSDGRGLALLMYNFTTGGQWCDFMAAAVRVSPGRHAGGLVPVPKEQLNVTGLDRAVVVQVFPPVPEGQEDTIEVVYSPPGASCLPTPLVFVPVEMGAAEEK